VSLPAEPLVKPEAPLVVVKPEARMVVEAAPKVAVVEEARRAAVEVALVEARRAAVEEPGARMEVGEPEALGCSKGSLLGSDFALCHLPPQRVGKDGGLLIGSGGGETSD